MSGIKKFGAGFWVAYVVVVVVYSVTGCVKFLLYNFWVFPNATTSTPPTAS